MPKPAKKPVAQKAPVKKVVSVKPVKVEVVLEKVLPAEPVVVAKRLNRDERRRR